MHAAKQTGNSSLRNQLLYNDIGNIDVRHETPMNQPQGPSQEAPQQQYQYHHHQQPPFDPRSQQPMSGYSPGLPGSQVPLNRPPNQRYYPPPQQRFGAPPQAVPSQGSRSSLTSNSSSHFAFFKGKRGKKGYSGGEYDDDDDDNKDVMLDSSNSNTMSFDDLTTIRDRGRYGGQSSYDSTPIIPTLASPSMKPGAPPSGKISNTQYRKQMTAFKKQVMVNAAGKVGPGGDPRAMSLQTGVNPYMNQDPRAMSLQSGGNSYLNDPRSRPPPQFQNGPRTNSLTGPPPMQNGPRAYSLTTNPYQRGPPPNLQQRAFPPGPHGPHPPNHGPKRPNPNMRGGPPPVSHRNSIPSAPSPLNQSQPSLTAGERLRSVPEKDKQHASHTYLDPDQNHQSHSEHFQQKPLPMPQNAQQQPLNRDYQDYEPFSGSNRQASSVDSSFNQSHHYLADNVQNDDNLDNSDLTTSREQSTFLPPKDESTPSPERKRIENDRRTELEPSPSKIPRSKGLPHLSLLSMRDEESDDEDINHQAFESEQSHSPQRTQRPPPQTRQSTDFAPRVLEPLDESKPYEVQAERSSTPPEAEISQFSRYSQSPGKTWNSPMKQAQYNSDRTSPYKKQLNSSGKHSKNSYSFSSMSGFSTVSETPTDTNESKAHMYNLAQASNTNNDVYLTASQFSLMGQENFKTQDDKNSRSSEYLDRENYENQSTMGGTSVNEDAAKTPIVGSSADSAFDPDKTPVVNPMNNASPEYNPTQSKRLSVDSLVSSKSAASSVKKKFSSPKFLKRWSKKRDERKISNTFEPVTQPIDINQDYPRDDAYSSVPSISISRPSGPHQSPPPQSASTIIGTGITTLDPTRSSSMRDDFGPNISASSKAISPTQDSYPNSPTASTPPTSGRADSLNTSVKPLDDFGQHLNALPVEDESVVNNKDLSLGDSFVPKKTDSDVKPFILTVDQLGIMEDKMELIRELDLVSKELANSIEREIQLEEKLRGSKHIGEVRSPEINGYETKLKDAASQIAELTQKLSKERKARYIAEEHVLLQERDAQPSPLELNYKNDQLKTELADKDELINKLTSEIEELKSENPVLKQKNEQLAKNLREAESVTIPDLQNKVEFLTNDQKRLSVLTEKFKILRTEKQDLEKKLEEFPERSFQSYGGGNLGDTSYFSEPESKPQSPINVRKARNVLPTDNRGFDQLVKPPSPMKNKRLTSFSLISVLSSQD